ncbi:MAG: outer membrane protein assembly factor BamD [Cyanobacteria bacterium J06623_7]
MTNNNEFQQKYYAGKQALERGQYRQSIEQLEIAKDLVAPNSRRGGEARVWLVTAYQAANKLEEAIALAQELVTHPDLQTREQAQRILYIMKAPVLERPKEWMSEIPDLAQTERSESRYVGTKKKAPAPPSQIELEDLEAVPTETKDSGFIWFALILVALIVGSLVWLS